MNPDLTEATDWLMCSDLSEATSCSDLTEKKEQSNSQN